MRILTIVALIFCLSTSYADSQFMVITDIHYGRDNVSKEGQDTSPDFLKIALQRMTELSKSTDFILNLGDIPSHMLFTTVKKEEYERTVFHALYEADIYKKPIFYIPGNNDSLGGNYQPFEDNGRTPLVMATDWDGACLYCDGLLVDKTHMRNGGYYSSYVYSNHKDILLIVLNTAPFARVPVLASPYPNQEKDANEELLWFAQQLKTHAAKQVLIAMHIPPGVSYRGEDLWRKEYVQQFISILERYASSYEQITLLTGHTHMDGLRKIALSNGRTIYAYSAPGVSPIHYNNPGIKIFQLNKNRLISNYTTYYTSSLSHWGNEHYQAVGAVDAIFPVCDKRALAQCLDSLSTKEVCHRLEDGLFESAKSEKVKEQHCEQTYLIH